MQYKRKGYNIDVMRQSACLLFTVARDDTLMSQETPMPAEQPTKV